MHWSTICWNLALIYSHSVYLIQAIVKIELCAHRTVWGVCTFSKLCTYWDNNIYLTCPRECAHLMVNIHLNSIGNELRVVHKYLVPVFCCVAFLRPTKLHVEYNCSFSNHNVIFVSDSIDSCTQETRQKTSIQLKARKPITLSLTAMLATQSEVCLNT